MEVNSTHAQLVETLINEGLNYDSIQKQLIALGCNGNELEDCMKVAKRLKYAKQQKLGVKLLALGAFICFSSCLLTFFHGYSATYAVFSLYGLTAIGACLLMAGLALVFGI